MKLKKQTKFLSIKKNWCKRCYFCIEFCPHDVFQKGDDGYPYIADLDKCTECGLCVALCPDFAIITEKEVEAKLKER